MYQIIGHNMHCDLTRVNWRLENRSAIHRAALELIVLYIVLAEEQVFRAVTFSPGHTFPLGNYARAERVCKIKGNLKKNEIKIISPI